MLGSFGSARTGVGNMIMRSLAEKVKRGCRPVVLWGCKGAASCCMHDILLRGMLPI